jgi:hypothetical protein
VPEAIRVAAAIIGPALILGATAGYIQAIFRRDVRPHRLGWTIWTIATAVGLAATTEGGSGLGAVVPATYLAIEAIVTALAWTPWYGYREKIGRKEAIVALVALIGVTVWPFLPLNLGALVAILGDSAAALFTLRKSIEDPESEALWPWAVSSLGAAIGLLTVAHWSFAAAGFPVYLVIQTGITAAAIHQSQKRAIEEAE